MIARVIPLRDGADYPVASKQIDRGRRTRKTEDTMQDLEIGGLTFRIEYRTQDEDRGPAIRVFGDVAGEPKQLLRFDCFDDDPHYHYDPTGWNLKFSMDELTLGDPLEFSLAQIGRHVATMIGKAKVPEAAARVDQAEVTSRVDEIRSTVESVKQHALSGQS
jgi:hypothetical protein